MRLKDKPIAIFDSGLGGLTVLSSVHRLLPSEDIVYLGDTARLPYGTKSKETITRYSIKNLERLLKSDPKVIVIGCNTASAYAIDSLRSCFSIPVIGVIEGGVNEVVSSRSFKIGIIATEATIASSAYESNIKQLLPEAFIYSKSCPLFVSMVEDGLVEGELALMLIDRYLKDMKDKIDLLLLACTHYPLLRKSFSIYFGDSVRLIDSADETAKLLHGFLLKEGLLSKKDKKGKIYLEVTDSKKRSIEMAKRFIDESVKIERIDLVDI